MGLGSFCLACLLGCLRTKKNHLLSVSKVTNGTLSKEEEMVLFPCPIETSTLRVGLWEEISSVGRIIVEAYELTEILQGKVLASEVSLVKELPPPEVEECVDDGEEKLENTLQDHLTDLLFGLQRINNQQSIKSHWLVIKNGFGPRLLPESNRDYHDQHMFL